MGLVRISHVPLFVSVEPASVCQLQCPACPVGMRNADKSVLRNAERFMSLDVWHRVLAEIRDTAFVVQFYFQGEPLLNKDLPTMIREAHEAGLYTIVSTNAQALTQALAEAIVHAGLDKIIVSMDGLTEESYNAYRVGGSLEKTKAAEQQYKVLGADRIVFKTAQLYDYANGHPLMPSDPRYSRYIKGTTGLYRRRRLSLGCARVWSGIVVTTNGEVLPCCYDKAHEYAYGNIMNTSLKELFTSEKANAFRRAACRQTPLICQECWK